MESLFGHADCCCICRLKIASALTDAHLHDNRRPPQGRDTVRLCWTCHRLYDHEILTTDEVLAGHAETYGQAWRPVDVSALHRRWERDLTEGCRRINKQRQHGRTPEQSSANARKAGETIRKRALK